MRLLFLAHSRLTGPSLDWKRPSLPPFQNASVWRKSPLSGSPPSYPGRRGWARHTPSTGAPVGCSTDLTAPGPSGEACTHARRGIWVCRSCGLADAGSMNRTPDTMCAVGTEPGTLNRALRVWVFFEASGQGPRPHHSSQDQAQVEERDPLQETAFPHEGRALRPGVRKEGRGV